MLGCCHVILRFWHNYKSITTDDSFETTCMQGQALLSGLMGLTAVEKVVGLIPGFGILANACALVHNSEGPLASLCARCKVQADIL